MNKIEKFCKEGYIEFIVNREPKLNFSIMCVNNGLWYKFNIDKVEQMTDNMYKVKSHTLISIDNNPVK